MTAILGYSNEEVKEMIDEYVQSIIEDDELEIQFIDSALHGSRLRGTGREDSDLDYVFEYSGDMSEDAVFNIMHEDPYYIDEVEVDINPIRRQESGSLESYMNKSNQYDKEVVSHVNESYCLEDHIQDKQGELRIIRVNKKHILNEDMGLATGITAGTSGTDLYNNGFSYEIKPLTSNLSQKGNDPSAENHNNSFKHFVGDVVKGYCPYDKKLHKGMIVYLYYKDSKSPIPMYVYIQDFTDESIVPLEADTLKNYKTFQIDDEALFKNPFIQNPWQARETQIDHDFAATAAQVKEALDLEDYDDLGDNSIIFNKEKIEDSISYSSIAIKTLIPYLTFGDIPSKENIDDFMIICSTKDQYKIRIKLQADQQLNRIFRLMKRAYYKLNELQDINLTWIDISNLQNADDIIFKMPIIKGVNSVNISTWKNNKISLEKIAEFMKIHGIKNVIY